MKYIKYRYIFGLLLLKIFFLASCVEEIDENQNRPIAGSDAYLSMTVDLGEALVGTRSGDVTGTVDELKIHSVRVVLYEGDDGILDSNRKVEYAFEFKINSGTWTPGASPTPGGWVNGDQTATGGLSQDGKYIVPTGDQLYKQENGKYQFVTFAQRVKAKKYKLLTIINGADSGQTTSPIYEATSIGKYFSSFEAAKNITIDQTTGYLIGSTANPGILMTNHQGLVNVTLGNLFKSSDVANKNPVFVAVDRLVAKVSVTHSMDFLNNLPQGLSLDSWKLDVTNKESYWMRMLLPGEVVQPPGESPTMANLYAVDPNYSVLSGTQAATAFSNLSNEGLLNPSSINNSFDSWEYVLENTMDAGSADSGQLTRIIVGYTYSPPELPNGASYYVYKNKIIEQAELDKYKLATTDAEIPAYLLGLRLVLASIDTNKYRLDGTSTDFFETNGLRFCPKGKLFYSIPIRHFDVPLGSPGYYGVVRNNMYKVTINKINPPGVGGPSLSADIHIQPWAGRSQTNKIGIVVDEEGDSRANVKIYYTSLKEKEPNQIDPLNLYRKWWAAEVGILPIPDYRLEKFHVGEEVDPRTMHIEMFPFGHFPNMYVPVNNLIVKAPPAENVIILYYSYGTGGGGVSNRFSVFFTDEEGNVLYIVDSYTGEATEPDGKLVRVTSDSNRQIYFSHLKANYIAYNNESRAIEYKIKDTDFIRHLAVSNTVVDGKCQFISGYVPEPVDVPYTGPGNPDPMVFAVICVKK